MGDEIGVAIMRPSDRKTWTMYYDCPATGARVRRSTGKRTELDARKVAAVWEADLRAGRYSKDSRMSWAAFRELWEAVEAPNLSSKTVESYCATLNKFEQLCRPRTLADLSTARVSAFAVELRTKPAGKTRDGDAKKLTAATIARHLRSLKAVANWAHRQELLPKVPRFAMPKRAATARMKGRPITDDEFKQLINAVEEVTGPTAAESWETLLWGLWLSGLRLGEALSLRWEQNPGGVWVVLDGQESLLAFDAGSQKSRKVEFVPLAPEAVELLEPMRREAGYVFPLLRRDHSGLALSRSDKKAIGKVITRIGEAAGIVVNAETHKAASAHDLRRAFGFRWSRRVMPCDLQTLMRHSTVETTMQYYVGRDAVATGRELWRALGHIKGHSADSVTVDATGGDQKTR